MADDFPQKSNYPRRPWWQWLFAYVVIAVSVYGLVYYFYPAKNTGNAPQNQNNSQTGSQTDSESISEGGQLPAPGKSLNLSNKGLKSIPSSVFSQADLQILDVSHNSLTGAIQAEIRQLANLKILDASYNQMTGVPAEIGQLQNLQILDLSHNKLTGLPYELGNLKNLKTLNLAGNQYSEQDLARIKKDLPNTNFIIK